MRGSICRIQETATTSMERKGRLPVLRDAGPSSLHQPMSVPRRHDMAALAMVRCDVVSVPRTRSKVNDAPLVRFWRKGQGDCSKRIRRARQANRGKRHPFAQRLQPCQVCPGVISPAVTLNFFPSLPVPTLAHLAWTCRVGDGPSILGSLEAIARIKSDDVPSSSCVLTACLSLSASNFKINAVGYPSDPKGG